MEKLVVISSAELEYLLDRVVKSALVEYQSPTVESDTSHKELLKVGEVAELLRLSVSCIKNYQRQGLIPFERIGGRVFFDKKAVLDSLNKIYNKR